VEYNKNRIPKIPRDTELRIQCVWKLFGKSLGAKDVNDFFFSDATLFPSYEVLTLMTLLLL
jgi:hypothetical protein